MYGVPIIAGVTTKRRLYGAAPDDVPQRQPIDLYLGVDCSGSMPNPASSLSYPVLAGTIIALSALRTGSCVMAVLSGEPGKTVSTEGFIRDERGILGVLTGYLGTGNTFGIHRLRETFSPRTATDRPVHILIVTDNDIFNLLDAKAGGQSGWKVARDAAAKARGGATYVLELPDHMLRILRGARRAYAERRLERPTCSVHGGIAGLCPSLQPGSVWQAAGNTYQAGRTIGEIAMQQEGPMLERLTHRLGECPEEFLLPPMTVAGGIIHVAALVADHLRKIGVQPDVPAIQERFDAAAVDRQQGENWLRLVAIGVWLLEDDWFLGRSDQGVRVRGPWDDGLQALARVVDAKTVVTDPDRREEFVRLCLKHLGLRPSGETTEYATDRLTTLDSVERTRVVREMAVGGGKGAASPRGHGQAGGPGGGRKDVP